MSGLVTAISPEAQKQDRWITTLVGREVDRGAKARLTEERGAKLGEVDLAIEQASTAAALLVAPIPREPVDAALLDVRNRRAALAEAAEIPALKAEIGKVPALLVDIGKAKDLATAAKDDWDKLVEARRVKLGEVDVALQQANDAAKRLVPPIPRGPVDSAIQDVTARRKALADAADAPTIKAETEKAPALLVDIGKAKDLALAAKDDWDKLVEARRVKLGEVDVALQQANDAAKLLVPPIPRGPVDSAILDVTIRRGALADAADASTIKAETDKAPALLVDIGKAKDLAVAAKLGWEKLLQDRQAKLLEVDTKLKEVTDAAPLILLKQARDPVDLVIAGLQTRRKGLADAADPTAIGDAMKLAPTLLSDIGLAKTQAADAKQDADDLGVRRQAVEDVLKTAGNWVGVMSKTTKPPFELELNALKLRVTNLGTAADLGAYTSAIGTLETDSVDLQSRARVAGAPDYATDNMKTLEIVARKLDGIKTPNPSRVLYDRLALEQKAAASLVGDARLNKLTDIGNAANWSDGWAAFQKREAIGKQLYALRVPLGTLPKNIVRSTLEGERSLLTDQIKDAFGRSDENIAAVTSALATAQNSADALKVKVDKAVVGQLNVDKAKERIAAALADAKKTIEALTDPVTKLGFENDHRDLVSRRDNALLITSPGNMKTELVAVEKAAMAMVERAHKASFEAKLKASDGKQKIAELIKTLGDRTDDLVAQAMCKAAMSACYKVDLQIPEGMSLTRLPKLFELFAMVPVAHLKGLTKLEYETDPDMSSSYHTTGKIVLNKIGAEGHMYAMDKNDPASEVNYFNATMLHELGHNADDANTIMGDKELNGDFGGWKKETVETVAAAHYETSFKTLVGTGKKPTKDDLMELIRITLQTGACSKPANATVKLGSLFDDWTSITNLQGYKNLALIRDGGDPWEKKIDCSDNRSYHEGYKGDWFSYATAARATSISDYMWRSPGEWFADQYSYYRLHKDKTAPTPIAAFMTAD